MSEIVLEGDAWGDLGNFYLRQGNPSKAIEVYELAMEKHKRAGNPKGIGSNLGNLGGAYCLLDNPYKAIELIEQALVIARKIEDRNIEGNALLIRSLSLNDLGERSPAIVDAEAAFKIFDEIQDPKAEKVRQQLAEWRS